MNKYDMLIEFDKVDLSYYDGPSLYKRGAVVSSLRKLYELKSEKEKNRIYNDVLFAVGNNHCGSYYPIILVALKYILDVTVNGETEISRNCALDCMFDLYSCFSPEVGAFVDVSPEEIEKFVKNTIEEHIPNLMKQLVKDESDRNKELVEDFLEFVKEESKE